jgi:acyl carrier protein
MDLKQELLTYILKEHLPGEAPDSLKPDDDLIGSGILDSLAMVNLVTHLEKHYGIVVGAEEMSPDNFGSVSALARFVAGKQASE